MINQLVQSAAKLSLISGVTLLSSLTPVTKTLALSTEEVVKTLKIPVFVVADEKGKPLVGQFNTKDKKDKKAFIYVFINRNDAKTFYNNLKKKSPDVIKNSQVVMQPLGSVYQTELSQSGKPNSILFLYIPEKQQVEQAKKVSKDAGHPYKGGVPLFVLTSVKNKGYLTIKQKDHEVIPLFLTYDKMKELLSKVKKEKPELAVDLKSDVIPLEGFMAKLKNSNDPNLTKFILVPSEDSIRAVREAEAKFKGAPK